MTPTTLVMAYYENASMLQRHYALIRSLPDVLKQHMGVVVVDDGSPTKPAFAEEIGCGLQVYRMAKDVRWNQDACRNIGVSHAETSWVLMTDMDHLVPWHTWQVVIRGSYDENIALWDQTA